MLYWLLSAFFLGYIAGTGLSPITMHISWLPYLLAFLSMLCALVLALSMPRTETTTAKVSINDQTTHSGSEPEVSSHRGKIDIIVSFFSESLAFVKAQPQLVLMITLFPLMASRGPLCEFILPYVSKRYGWSLGQVNTIRCPFGWLASFVTDSLHMLTN